jgi:erythronate-4-phosphate dehydrogenase
VDRSLLESSAVRFVGTLTIGTDHIDLEYLKSRNIGFASAPGSNANSVAEYVVAALLTWAEKDRIQLGEKSIGIVGVGNVGRIVAKYVAVLGMRVILNDPPLARVTGDPRYRPLDELMEADVVTLHVPLTRSGQDATVHLFGTDRIRAMKRGSVLINTSRGAVVDSNALLQALESKRISAAVLDVWENEPDIPVGLLERTFIGTPHISGYSLDGKLNATEAVYKEVCRYLGAEPSWKRAKSDDEPKEIRVTDSNVQGILRDAVRQAYNIEMDDSALKEIAGFPREQQAKHFTKLRATYGVRREFAAYRVVLEPLQCVAKKALQELGFAV